jgi:hypothetical protein
MTDWIARSEDVPGDGLCLFHALGRPFGVPGQHMVASVIDFVENNADLTMHGTSIRQWIEWYADCSVDEYIQRLRAGMWGGALETTIIASLTGLPVYVYSPSESIAHTCTRITDALPDLELHQSGGANPLAHMKTDSKFLCLLYIGRSHYECLWAKRR